MVIHRNSSPPVDDIELATETDTHCSVGIASHLSTNILTFWSFCCGMCANNISNENPAQPQPEQVQRHGQEVQLCPDRPPSSTPPVAKHLNVILKKDIIVDLSLCHFDIAFYIWISPGELHAGRDPRMRWGLRMEQRILTSCTWYIRYISDVEIRKMRHNIWSFKRLEVGAWQFNSVLHPSNQLCLSCHDMNIPSPLVS